MNKLQNAAQIRHKPTNIVVKVMISIIRPFFSALLYLSGAREPVVAR